MNQELILQIVSELIKGKKILCIYRHANMLKAYRTEIKKHLKLDRFTREYLCYKAGRLDFIHWERVEKMRGGRYDSVFLTDGVEEYFRYFEEINVQLHSAACKRLDKT